MCNIAGYAGERRAAPILLEMIARQEPYDGDMSVGVATFYEGKIHTCNCFGNVERMLRETDAADLPGTVGIAHTRPSRGPFGKPLYPFMSGDKSVALVSNGTSVKTRYSPNFGKTLEILDRMGYEFEFVSENGPGTLLPRTGQRVFGMRVHNVHRYLSEGKSPAEALAAAEEDCYGEHATVMICEQGPDSINAFRNTRPLYAVTRENETFLATSRFGLPEDLAGAADLLPLGRSVILRRGSYEVTGFSHHLEPVSPNSPYTYREGYKRLEEILTSDRAPMYFDELEFALNDMRDLWEGDHTLVPHASLLYELLWQFDREGRLKREMRVQDRPDGPRRRWYFSL